MKLTIAWGAPSAGVAKRIRDNQQNTRYPHKDTPYIALRGIDCGHTRGRRGNLRSERHSEDDN
eukprot:scaffold32300_cov118-Isochrysis_galbana.AAC.1